MPAPTTLGLPTDHELVAEVAAVVARPPVDPPDSFVLHAALELGARHDLLPRVHADAREAVRARITEIGAAYERWAVAPDPEPPTASLAEAVRAGDVAGADAAAATLARGDAQDVVAPVADLVLPALTAAGHGVIALDRLARTRPGDPVGAAGLRLLAREAAGAPDRRLSWHLDLPSHPPRIGAAAPSLVEVLVAPPSPGDPGSSFIYPTLHRTEASGLAAELLTGPLAAVTDLDAAGRDLLAVAAHSMLQDGPEQAPYGWSHCLTLPLGALGVARWVADPRHALAVAATYVLAFRATQGRVALDLAWTPPRPASASAGAVLEALAGAPEEAVPAAWHAPADVRPLVVAELCSYAASHHDAHLAKYTLACCHAAARDPERASLHLAAAAHLGAWWRTGAAG